LSGNQREKQARKKLFLRLLAGELAFKTDKNKKIASASNFAGSLAKSRVKTKGDQVWGFKAALPAGLLENA
jgi:hypothetical protein